MGVVLGREASMEQLSHDTFLLSFHSSGLAEATVDRSVGEVLF